jgi:hypothetical protein
MKTTLAAALAVMVAVSPAAAQTVAPLTFVEKQTASEVLGSDFIGTPVNGKEGQPIGKIANLVFGPEGSIELAVIGVGGFLGVGEKDVAVPFDAIKSDTVNGKHVFVIDATKEQLKAAPSYQTLKGIARQEQIAKWRAEAQKSWADIKAKTAKAYEEAKQRVEEKTQGK